MAYMYTRWVHNHSLTLKTEYSSTVSFCMLLCLYSTAPGSLEQLTFDFWKLQNLTYTWLHWPGILPEKLLGP